MTTATTSALDRPARIRRKPRQPLLAPWLLLLWLVIFVGGMTLFVYWIMWDAHPVTGQPRLLTGSVLTIVGMALSWLLLVWRARLLQALDRKVKGARGAVCLNCHKVLTHEGQEGACPECGEAFTLAHNRDVWQKHTP